jgi:hypothetical protein
VCISKFGHLVGILAALTLGGASLAEADWWGYTGGSYAVQSAPQMTAIMSMVQRITSGY